MEIMASPSLFFTGWNCDLLDVFLYYSWWISNENMPLLSCWFFNVVRKYYSFFLCPIRNYHPICVIYVANKCNWDFAWTWLADLVQLAILELIQFLPSYKRYAYFMASLCSKLGLDILGLGCWYLSFPLTCLLNNQGVWIAEDWPLVSSSEVLLPVYNFVCSTK